MPSLWKKIRRVFPVPYQVYQHQQDRITFLEIQVDNIYRRLQSSMLHQRQIIAQRLSDSFGKPEGHVQFYQQDYRFDDCLCKLRQLAPVACQHWERLLRENANAYCGFPIDSCSVSGHPVAEQFRLFLQLYLHGNVLDIGCGPQPVPCYLNNHPTHCIAGIDPLSSSTIHPFTFVQGVAEFLPWADKTFDLVVAATSLDHVLLLDKALSEIRRVLRPNGYFVTWVSFIPGSPEYDPYSSDITPVDCYHLFHFDRPWFEKIMSQYFTPVEFFDVDGQSSFWSFSL